MPSRFTRCLRYGYETQTYRDCLGSLHYLSPAATKIFFLTMLSFIVVVTLLGAFLPIRSNDAPRDTGRDKMLALRRAGWSEREIAERGAK